MDTKKMSKLLNARKVLQSVSNETFNYSVVNKQNPIASIETDEKVEEMIYIYHCMIKEISDITNKYLQESHNN